MNNSFTKQIDKWRPHVWKVIKSYLPKNNDAFAESISEYPRRQGRYIRPTLLLACYEALGGKESKAILTAAAIQTAGDWLLIHDDVQDKSVARRDMPSLNKIYGDALSINTGDSLHLLMWHMLCDNANELGPNIGLRIMQEMQEMLYITTMGQFYELSLNKNTDFLTTEEDYFKIVDQKTSRYTITTPIRLALILTKKEKYLSRIETLGPLWGRVFQLRNDLNNLKQFKSAQNSDIAEGKRNIPFIHLWQKSNSKEKIEIKKIYSKNSELKTDNEIAFVLALMEKYQSINYTENLLDQLLIQAREAIHLIQPIAKTETFIQTLLDALEYTTSPQG